MELTATNPVRHVVWAIIWVFFACLGVVAFAVQADTVLSGELTGQRTEGFFLLTPLLFVAAAALCVVLAIKSIPPWRRLRASLDIGQRRYHRDRAVAEYPVKLLFTVGAVTGLVSLVGGGYLVLGWSLITSRSGGLATYIVVLGLFVAATGAALDAGIRSVAAARRLRAHGQTR